MLHNEITDVASKAMRRPSTCERKVNEINPCGRREHEWVSRRTRTRLERHRRLVREGCGAGGRADPFPRAGHPWALHSEYMGAGGAGSRRPERPPVDRNRPTLPPGRMRRFEREGTRYRFQ